MPFPQHNNGFMAHAVFYNGAWHCGQEISVTADGTLQSVNPITTEKPFTKFYDGALVLLAVDASEDEVLRQLQSLGTQSNDAHATLQLAHATTVANGERCRLYQLNPFDVAAQQFLVDTRCVQLLG